MDKVNHIAIVVPEINQAVKTYQEIFDVKVSSSMIMDKFEVKIALLEFENIKIEFIQPLGESGEFYEFLKTTGGLHHMAVEVDDLSSKLDTLKQKNIKMKDDQPKQGSQNSLVAFSEKESFDGVVIEFKQLNSGK